MLVRRLIALLGVVVMGAACADSVEGVRSQLPGEAAYDNGVDDVIRVNPVIGLEVHVIESADDTEAETTTLEVSIGFERSEQSVGPRIAEMYLEHSDTLTFVDAEAGEAALAAGKTVIGQAKPNERVRVIVFSAGSEQLDSGNIATVRFTGVGDGPFMIQLSGENQIFAPVEANGNLLVGEAVVIE